MTVASVPCDHDALRDAAALRRGRCAESNGFSYLELTVRANGADPRIDDIGGDLTPEWGLHLVDANVAMGDLVAIAQSQGTRLARAATDARQRRSTACNHERSAR